MARINAALLERLGGVLGVGKRRVYELVESVASETMLDSADAALVLAARNQINLNRYSSAEDRARIRGALHSRSSPQLPVAETPTARAPKVRKAKASSRRIQATDNSVFVVHGRNTALRKSMFAFLRALGLFPKEWEKAILEASGNNPHVDTIVETAMERAQAVVVLLSAEDDVKLRDEYLGAGERATEGKLQGQPRPNVIFEAGLALGRHSNKTLLVQVGKIKPMSDIFGKHITRLTNGYSRRNDLANRLAKIGCKIDRQGSDWTTEGDFDL